MLKLLLKPFGCLASLLGGLLVLLVIALIVLFWVAEAWTPKFVAGWMEQSSGFDVQIDDANLELFSQQLVFEDIVIQNPPGFPEESFLRIRGLAVKLPLADVASQDFRASAVSLDIDSLTIVIPERGPSNIAAFIDAVDFQPAAVAVPASDAPRLESFRLTINEVIIEDHSFRRPDITRYKIGYEGNFSNISRSTDVFPEVERELRARNLPGLDTAFFQALFAALPVQCFADIEPAVPGLLPDQIDGLTDEIGQTLRDRAVESLRPQKP
ncbi:hypothetical protein H5P28_18835 [Ruficoccus amylovorans]|uniref:AsmA family protein n=1 Tax=Ruficoccus amylovorans TaxID=1804625 RepID=A0A842HK54_9BACT|nr:hypothetical protein [Ruficoccus amylovorans]MBC2596328.1 hypothetical protein [Ruficoccus amylovorans]